VGGVRSIKGSALDAAPSLSSLFALLLSKDIAGDGEFGGLGWIVVVAFCNSGTFKGGRAATAALLFGNMEADRVSESHGLINQAGFFLEKMRARRLLKLGDLVPRAYI
jgi:hypothetical protein